MPDKNNKQAGHGKSERFSVPRLKLYLLYHKKVGTQNRAPTFYCFIYR